MQNFVESQDIKPTVEMTVKSSKITIESVTFDRNDDENPVQFISCFVSGITSMWWEKIDANDAITRLKKCNPFLACSEAMISTILKIPDDETDIQITETNNGLHLNTKYYLSDGSDRIPLKFYWSLGKVCCQSFYENYSKMMLKKVSELEERNASLLELIRRKEEEIFEQLNKTLEDSRVAAAEDLDNSNKESDDQRNPKARLETIQEDVGPCHEGVACNNCGDDIIGNRYSCVECEDYDLCMSCEFFQKQHTHHIMIRYAEPIDKIRFDKIRKSGLPRTSRIKKTRNSK